MILKHNNRTEKIFHKIHLQHIEQKIAYKRVSNLLNYKNLKLKKNYFKEKICADFGCGATGAGAYNLLKMNAKFVCLIDINKKIKEKLKKNLIKFKGKYSIDIGTIEKTNYKSNYFDFILCQGVIHHAYNDLKCLKEIHRTLKKNGKCYLMVQGEGGLLNNFVMKIVRNEYKKNLAVKNFFNNIMRNNIKKYKIFIDKNYDKKSKKIINYLKKYFDKDLLLTMQDLILAPKYKTYNEKKLKKLLSRIGFKNIYRIKKKVKYENIRRLLSPLYYNYDNEISKVLYGEGNINLVMTKK